jgi:hypothetical protein
MPRSAWIGRSDLYNWIALEEAYMTGTDDEDRIARRKEMMRAASRTWRLANPDKMAAARAAWREAHRSEATAYTASWRKAHPEETRAQRKAFYAAHRDELLAARKAAYRAAKKRNTDGEPT